MLKKIYELQNKGGLFGALFNELSPLNNVMDFN